MSAFLFYSYVSFCALFRTCRGQIQDETSLKLIDHDIFSMETHKQGGLTMLKKPLHFDALIETEEY